MSPRTVVKQFRDQLPDTIEALKKLPQIFQTAVREASEGRLRLTVEHSGMLELRRELRDSDMRRDIALAAAVLWLSGSVWLTAAQHYRWVGGLQMAAAVVSLAWYRSLRRQVK